MYRWVFAISLCTFLQGSGFAQAAGEQVLYNGKIFTAEPEHPYAEAVAFRGDKIVAVGNRGEVSKTVASGAEMINLKGNFLLPGMIDSHCHAVDGGLSLISADIGENVSSVDELMTFAVEAKKSGRGMQGDILTVGGIPLAFWSKNKELNEHFNTGSYANQPVLLEGMDGHTAWANRALLKRAGIDKQLISSLDSVGRGYYGFEPNFEPNGFLVDAGVDKVSKVVPKPSQERMLAAGRAAVGYMHGLGITAWLDADASEAIRATYRGLAERGELDSHVVALPVIEFKKGHPEQ